MQTLILAIKLLFHIKNKKILEHVPWPGSPQFGMNGPMKHRAKVLLGVEMDLSLHKFANAVILKYDREQEIDGNPVPWYKIYWMRLTWLRTVPYENEK